MMKTHTERSKYRCVSDAILFQRCLNSTSVLAVLALMASNLSSQSVRAPISDIGYDSIVNRVAMADQKKEVQNGANVTVKIKDATVRSILQSLAKMTDVPIVFNSADSRLSKKASIDVDGVSLMEAVRISLSGTGLNYKKSPDGKSILIGNSAESGESKKQNEKGIVSGIVVDSVSGEGVDGVVVSVNGLNRSAVTNGKGTFILDSVPLGTQQIVFKRIGYRSIERTIDIQAGVNRIPNVKLWKSTTSLSEVVTTATGLQRRVEIPNDIVRIDGDKMRERAPVRSVMDMIEAAQVPGVVMTRASGDPGAAARIRIRGVGSISQSNDPVVIVDGMWVDATVQSPSRLDQIDPQTIETIEIVRGPSAATLYGQNASNGVIVITTKKGTAGTTRWNLSYSRDWGKAYGTMPLFYEGWGYNPITGARMKCSIANVLDNKCVQDSVAVYDPNNRMVLREGQEQKDIYSVSLDGGSNTVKYAISASTNDVLGVRRAAPVDLIRLRKLNMEYDSKMLKPSSLINHTVSSNLSLYPRDNVDLQLTVKAGYGNLTNNSYNLKDIGNFDNPLSIDTLAFMTDGRTRIFNQISNLKRTRNTAFGSSATWRSKYGFLVKGNGGIDYTSMNESGSQESDRCRFMGCDDSLGTRFERSQGRTVASLRTNISTVLTRGRLATFIELRPTAGFDFRRVSSDNFSIQKDSVPSGESSIESGRVLRTLGQRVENADAGWYLSSTIGILKRVYFDLGLRQDIGSAITSTSNTTYPKLGGSWLVSDEGFWPENRLINIFKVRGAIGHAAVQPDVTDVKGKYVVGSRFVDGKIVKTLELAGVGNSELTPERAVELEVGVDMEVLEERVNIVATYSHKENKNTLVSRRLPPELVGATELQRKENIGRVQNRNVELAINSVVLDKDWLRVLVDYSHTISDNRVKSLGKGTNNFKSDDRDYIAVGYPLGSIWDGQILGYSDENGDGMLSNSERVGTDAVTYIGTSTPRYRGSYGINTAIFGKIIIDSRFSYQSSYVVNYSLTSDLARNYYGSQDINAPLAVQAASYLSGGGDPVTDFRWNSASISYSLSPRRISFLNTRNITLALQAKNIGLWTKFVGRDPWVNNNILSKSEIISVDYGATPPPPRTFALNIKMGL